LIYKLRVSYYSIYFDDQTIINLEKQLAHVSELVEVYTEQAEKGNVPFKDIVRLQSFYMELQNKKTELRERILEEEKNLKVLLGTGENIIPQPTPNEVEIEKTQRDIAIDTLFAYAVKNRPDVQLAEYRIESEQWNLKWQKSLAIPNILIGGAYDQRGGAFNNQVNLTVGIPLPIINRNQGNIKTARAYLSQAEMKRNQLLLEVKNEVKMTYEKYIQSVDNYQTMTKNYNRNFELVYIGILKNFQMRNVSMLEFIDFMESYNNTISHVNEIKKNILQSYEEMNLAVTQNLFK
jgi:cobalt-zinc-cadmium efflux system outer membrane protein